MGEVIKFQKKKAPAATQPVAITLVPVVIPPLTGKRLEEHRAVMASGDVKRQAEHLFGVLPEGEAGK